MKRIFGHKLNETNEFTMLICQRDLQDLPQKKKNHACYWGHFCILDNLASARCAFFHWGGFIRRYKDICFAFCASRWPAAKSDKSGQDMEHLDFKIVVEPKDSQSFTVILVASSRQEKSAWTSDISQARQPRLTSSIRESEDATELTNVSTPCPLFFLPPLNLAHSA